MKQFLKDKRLETWAWESGNALVVLLIVMLGELELTNPLYIILVGGILGLLNQVTKYINLTYLKK